MEIEIDNEINNEIDTIFLNNNQYLQNNYNYYDNFYELYLHFYLITTFEIIFYFYYVVEIEKTLVSTSLKEFGRFINDNIIYTIDTNDDYINLIDNYCQDFKKNWVYKPNQTLKENSLLFIFINSIGFIFFTFCHYLKYNQLTKIKYHIYKSFCFIIIITIFEYLFFNFVVLKYHIIDNYQSTCIIINQFKEFN